MKDRFDTAAVCRLCLSHRQPSYSNLGLGSNRALTKDFKHADTLLGWLPQRVVLLSKSIQAPVAVPLSSLPYPVSTLIIF